MLSLTRLAALTVPLLLGCDAGPTLTALPAGSLTLTALLDLPAGTADTVRFERIADATRMRDGRIVVADDLGGHLVVVDSLGQELGTVGRVGAGPGEFRHPNWVERCAGDSLFVNDPMQGRVSVFDARGRFARQFTPSSGLPARMACDGRGVFAVLIPTAAWSPASIGDLKEVKGRGLLLDTNGGEVGSFGSVVLGENRTLGRVTVLSETDSGFAFGVADTSRFVFVSRTGGRSGSVDLGLPRRPATDSSFTAAVEEAVRSVPGSPEAEAQVRGILRRDPPPEHLPAYRGLHSDRAGHLWAVLSAWGAGKTDLVRFPATVEGRATYERAVVPVELDLFEAGPDYLLGKYFDAEGMEHLVMYRIETASTP